MSDKHEDTAREWLTRDTRCTHGYRTGQLCPQCLAALLSKTAEDERTDCVNALFSVRIKDYE